MDKLALWIGIIGGLTGILGSLFGAFGWWSASIRKGYAAQRDFEHLKNNYQAISSAIAQIDKDLDEIRQTTTAVHTLTLCLPEIKAFILAKFPDTQGWMSK